MLVKAIESSANRKLGPVATTSVSQVSCPSGCPWYDDGKQGSPCYANNGFLGWSTAKLNRAHGTHIDAAREEAEVDPIPVRLASVTATRSGGLQRCPICASGRQGVTRVSRQTRPAGLDVHACLEGGKPRGLGQRQCLGIVRYTRRGCTGECQRLCDGHSRGLFRPVESLRYGMASKSSHVHRRPVEHGSAQTAVCASKTICCSEPT